MKLLKKMSAVIWVLIAAAVISGCASTYYPVGEPREGVVEQKVVVK